jgi:dienelactone hydrolase
LPGVSGGVFSDRYKLLVDACLEADTSIARLGSYKDSTEFNEKTIEELHADIDAAISFLQGRCYTSLFGIGKSFGGALMLTQASPIIQTKVLWAPAIAAEAESNLEVYRTVLLGSIPMLMDIHVDQEFLKQIKIPTMIVHGTADDQIPFSNSEKMVSMLPNAKLKPIEGGDHSYKNKEHEALVIQSTIDFLKSK